MFSLMWENGYPFALHMPLHILKISFLLCCVRSWYMYVQYLHNIQLCGYMLICVCEATMGGYWVSFFITLYLVSFKQSFSLNLGLGWQPASSTSPGVSTSPSSELIGMCSLDGLFTCTEGCELGSSCFSIRYSYILSHACLHDLLLNHLQPHAK